MPAVGSSSTRMSGSVASHLPMHHLLLVAARQRRDGVVAAGRLDATGAAICSSATASAPWRRPPCRAWQSRKDGDATCSSRPNAPAMIPLARAVFGHQRHAGGDGVRRLSDGRRSLPSTLISPAMIGSMPGDHARRRGAARAEQAGEAHYLAAMHDEATLSGLSARRHSRAPAAPRRRRLAAHHVGEPARAPADDVLDHRLDRQFRQRRGDDMAAVAQDRRAVGDARDLVHAVADSR